MHVLFSVQALEDLADIAVFIAEDSPARAVTFAGELKDKAMTLREMPHKGADRSEVKPGLRLLPHGHYNIYYRIGADQLEVLRILHSARNLEADDLN